jgi:hypothetical protein
MTSPTTLRRYQPLGIKRHANGWASPISAAGLGAAGFCSFGVVERSANNPVVVYEAQSFVGDDLFELIFGRPGARNVRRAGFRRNMVPPVPTQGVIMIANFRAAPLIDAPAASRRSIRTRSRRLHP